MNPQLRRRGYSLIEVVTVLGLMTMLTGLLLTCVQQARGAANRAACGNCMRQIGMAVSNYESRHGHFPASGFFTTFPNEAPEAERVLGWHARILPDMGLPGLWDEAVAALGVNPDPTQAPSQLVRERVVSGYLCPAEHRLAGPVVNPQGIRMGMTSYIGSAGSFISPAAEDLPNGRRRVAPGIFHGTPSRTADVRDGLSQTLLAGERPPPQSFQAGKWHHSVYVPAWNGGPDGVLLDGGPGVFGDHCVASGRFGPGRVENPCDRYHYWSLHLRGANFLTGDGSVRFLRHGAEDIVSAMASRAGGELVAD